MERDVGSREQREKVLAPLDARDKDNPAIHAWGQALLDALLKEFCPRRSASLQKDNDSLWICRKDISNDDVVSRVELEDALRADVDDTVWP